MSDSIKDTDAHIDSTRGVCDQCGEVRETVFPIILSGGYSCNLLFDGRRYEFDLCEECIVQIMNGLKVAPVVEDSEDGTVTWETDRAHRAAQNEKEAQDKAAQADAVAHGLCSKPNKWGIAGVCNQRAVAFANDEPRCATDIIDYYSFHYQMYTIRQAGEELPFEKRAEIARAFLDRFYAGDFSSPTSFPEMIVAASTLASLMLKPQFSEMAMKAIQFVFSPDLRVPRAQKWIDARVASAFAPGDPQAVWVNDWLTHLRESGYREAVAHALLGYSAEQLWGFRDLCGCQLASEIEYAPGCKEHNPPF